MMYHPIAACTGIFLLLLTACSNPDTRPEDGAAAPAAWAESGPDRPVEFADRRYADTVLYYQQLFAEGDMIAWAEQFADSAVFIWSSGDSLVGKPAIYDYYAERRGAYIESLRFTDHIYLPVRVHTPQSIEAPGIWVLSWYRMDAVYKSGETVSQWIHNDLHFNDDGKVDRVVQFIDRGVIPSAPADK